MASKEKIAFRILCLDIQQALNKYNSIMKSDKINICVEIKDLDTFKELGKIK
jgi:hypothetical protein